ncbi:spondin domain-containing protein [Halobacteriaceae archaeon GCM10025711]
MRHRAPDDYDNRRFRPRRPRRDRRTVLEPALARLAPGFLVAGGAATAGLLAVGGTNVLGQQEQSARTFTVRIENVSTGMTLMTTADGEASEQPVPLSPGAYAVHTRDEPIFSEGEPERDNGLEEIAEDGMPGKLAESLAGRDTVVDSGAFATPEGMDSPGPLLPGHAYEFSVTAASGNPRAYLSLVTMFIPSNDLFLTLGGAGGLPLFKQSNGMAPMAGNVTDHVSLWDAGTEVNEEPGTGPNQAQRQSGAGVGLVERGTVAPIEAVNGYDYPAVSDVVKVTLTPQ